MKLAILLVTMLAAVVAVMTVAAPVAFAGPDRLMQSSSGGDDHGKDGGLTVVPEPATIMMLTLGTLALLGRHRSKR